MRHAINDSVCTVGRAIFTGVLSGRPSIGSPGVSTSVRIPKEPAQRWLDAPHAFAIIFENSDAYHGRESLARQSLVATDRQNQHRIMQILPDVVLTDEPHLSVGRLT